MWAFLTRLEVLMYQDRSSEMWTPRNFKSEKCSTIIPLMWIGFFICPVFLMKSTICYLVLPVLRSRLLLLQPHSQVLYLLNLGCFGVVSGWSPCWCKTCYTQACSRGWRGSKGMGWAHNPAVRQVEQMPRSPSFVVNLEGITDHSWMLSRSVQIMFQAHPSGREQRTSWRNNISALTWESLDIHIFIVFLNI